jgi:glycosyltransferase involved in cell wall biosynthesis/SAM-dependent methyltransferase
MSRYAFEFAWDSTYGIAAKMLDDVSRPGLVLDLGCGEATFAQPVTELGREYLGVELDQGSVDRCREAGLDVHLADLANPDTDAVHDRLVELVDGRDVAAISLLDVIEHLVDPARVFADLARLVERLGGPTLVVSIPNVTHIDIATKLLLGRWDMTTTGLLDDTHVTFFDHARVDALPAAAGFVEIDRRDKQMTVTEQEFPLDHPAVSRATTLRQFAEAVRALPDEHRDTYQFVRAYRFDAAAAIEQVPGATTSKGPQPFCSVLVRTQGGRASIDDALTCLAAQTDRDIEVIVAVHSDDVDVVAAVEARIARYASAFQRQIVVLPIPGGGRSAPLNAGLEAASGRYLAFLDDDDVVTANWIEEFRAAAVNAPGTVLRAQCVAQEHARTPDGLIEFAPIEGFSAPYNPEFDLVQHRQFNQSPICSWAVPLGAVHALRLRFDDELPVLEDWEFLVRAAGLLGVSNRSAFTSVYRRFTDGWGSTKTIDETTWLETAYAIRNRLDMTPTLLPAGSIEPMARLREDAAAMTAAYDAAIAQVEAFERSRYWKLTAPLRWVTGRRGASISLLKLRLNEVRGRIGPQRRAN